MTDADLEPGTQILLKGFTQHSGNGAWSLSWGKPKNGYHIAIWMGVWTAEDSAGPDERLNAMGWVYDPERGHAEAMRLKAEREAAK